MISASDFPQNDGGIPDKSGSRSGDEGDFDLSGFNEPAPKAGEGSKKRSEAPAAKPKAAGEKKGLGPNREWTPKERKPRTEGFGPREGYNSRPAGPGASRGPGAPRTGRGDFPSRVGDRRPAFDRQGNEPKPWDKRRPGGPIEKDKAPGGYGPGIVPRNFSARPGLVPNAVAAHDRKQISPEVKPFLLLKQDKGRWRESRFLLEGAKNILDVLAISPDIVTVAFTAPDFKDKELLLAFKKNRIAVVPVLADDIAALSDTETPQGIIAVCNFATLRPDWNLVRYVTLMDAVQDPGNVGAIFRTSLALGMDAVVLGKGSCDPYNPKVARSSVGALLGLPFETGEELGSKIAFLRQKGFSIVATSSHAKITLDGAKLRKKVALIVGNEGSGTGASYLDMADAVVKIPLKSKVESLNVAVAHGIMTYQLIHGRE